MRTFITLLLGAAVLSAPARAGDEVKATYRTDLAAAVDQLVERNLHDLLSYYKDLHSHPELSLQEKESARKIAEHLKAAGYDVTTNVGGHGVVAMLANGPGPTVLIRADMDALPVVEETGLPYHSTVTATGSDGQTVGVMHACGHDVHQTCLVGTARALMATRDRWSGTVMIIAQPAEEIGTGARMMIEDGLFERFARPEYCLALHVSASHPAGTVAYTPGWALANVDSVDITIYGRGGHGSRPHETVDPVITAAQVIVALQTIVSRRLDPIQPGVITVGSIHAGSKHNIIPNDAKLQITVRSYRDESRRLLLDGIRDVTLHTCRAMGCTRDPEISIKEDEYTPAAFNDPALAEAAAGVFERVLGAENVQETQPVMGGEDFGRYSGHLGVPGLLFWVGAVETGLYEASQRPGGPCLSPIHSSTFAPDPEPTIRTGVRCMTSLALSLLGSK
jgi:hippurate hydrolase